MSDFILPGDMEQMAQLSAANLADSWERLAMACYVAGVKIQEATRAVIVKMDYMSEIEAVQEVYKLVVMGKF
jgi:hypothetical protein